jgi:phosphatidylinositol glycan class U
VQEGLFLYVNNISPYDGGICHQAPLLLPIFSLLPEYRHVPTPTHLVFVAADVLTALALAKIAESGISTTSRLFTSSRKEHRWTSNAVVAA